MRSPYWRDGCTGSAADLVQVTHKVNYVAFGITKADALKLDVSVRVLFDGMIKGIFTGKAVGLLQPKRRQIRSMRGASSMGRTRQN